MAVLGSCWKCESCGDIFKKRRDCIKHERDAHGKSSNQPKMWRWWIEVIQDLKKCPDCKGHGTVQTPIGYQTCRTCKGYGTRNGSFTVRTRGGKRLWTVRNAVPKCG